MAALAFVAALLVVDAGPTLAQEQPSPGPTPEQVHEILKCMQRTVFGDCVPVEPSRLPPESAPAPGKKLYVALGDSYSSGEGAPIVKADQLGVGRHLFLEGTQDPGNHCHRSERAYPVSVWRGLGDGWGLDFRACSGGTTGNFDRSIADHRETTDPDQREALSGGVDLVTILDVIG